ncbi:hypothetical protein T459_29775 [Capsicum annuum]|uniref:MULE transposase domain-containing protein n=1 Tax=Capsicum annuum TaxID=4072 RepID=A0A2G2Y6J1_CAPAN|nr:hypothetical protein T459_29775 [Capsicum annuum]
MDDMPTEYDFMGCDEWNNSEDYEEKECGGGEHTCGVDHVTKKHKNVTVEAELLEVLDGRRHCEEHSLRVDEESGRFIYYFMAFGASIRGYAHTRKVVVVDDTHLSGKYEGVLLSAVAQDTQNHIYPLAYCVVDKKNDMLWGFFFENLKAFVVDEPELLRLKHGNEYDTSIYNYSSQIDSKESYLLAYLEPICTAPLESEWSVTREYLEMQVLPPDFDPKLRRRKVKCVKGVLEPSRYKKRNKCSKYKRPGHRRTTCSLNVG